jgi:hypothetical protein
MYDPSVIEDVALAHTKDTLRVDLSNTDFWFLQSSLEIHYKLSHRWMWVILIYYFKIFEVLSRCWYLIEAHWCVWVQMFRAVQPFQIFCDGLVVLFVSEPLHLNLKLRCCWLSEKKGSFCYESIIEQLTSSVWIFAILTLIIRCSLWLMVFAILKAAANENCSSVVMFVTTCIS